MNTQTHSEAVSAQPARSFAQYYLGILRRRRWPILLSLLVPIALSIIFSGVQKKQYQATAQVLLSRQNLANTLTNTPDPTGAANDYIRIVQTQADVARSPQVARRVIAATGARLTPQEFLDTSDVQAERDADLLTFHVTRQDPHEALFWTRAYARQFTDYRLALDTSSLRKAQREVQQRLSELKGSPSASPALISSLISKEQQLATFEALQTSNATVVSSPVIAHQVAPRWKRNLALGILAGLILAMAIAAAFESLDTRVRSIAEVEERLVATPLATVGPPSSDVRGRLVMLESPQSVSAEAFRVLRTNIQFTTVDRGVRSIMVTSAIAGEGKSTTIGNLAVAMARAGDRVILVELDLRKPTFRTTFALPPGPGLTDVMLGRAPIDEALTPIPVEMSTHGDAAPGSLEVLTAGTMPPNPGEILASPAIAEIVRSLESRADIVLIDAPPILLLGDALALTTVADELFLCVKMATVTRSMLDDLRRALTAARVVPLGFVATGDLRAGDSSYGYSGYGYGYGYGYGAQAGEHSPEAPVASDDVLGRSGS